jgi:multiple sugar transport system ATP-binding protein
MSNILLKNISKSYTKNNLVVSDFNLEINSGEFVVLLGPSGCGKTTTLRMIAGIENITSGDLFINDIRMNDLSPDERSLSFVFQNYALFPYLTVYDNIAFELYSKKVNKLLIKERVEKISNELGLYKHLNKRPNQLSGGERQRVAIARSLIRDTDIILMDEPLSNLDAKLRVELRGGLSKIHHNLKKTIVYVTHDQVEALTLATKIVVMNQGFIVQIGSPLDIYENPSCLFVAQFIGSISINTLIGVLNEDHYFKIKDLDLSFKISDKLFLKLKEKNYINKQIYYCIRPDDILLTSIADEYTIILDYSHSELLGSKKVLSFSKNDLDIRVLIDGNNLTDTNKFIKFNQEKVFVFDYETKEAI